MADTAVRPRPIGDLRLHFMTDTNAGPNNIQDTVTQRNMRQMKLPPSRGRFDIDSFQQDRRNPGFVKFHEDTSWRTTSMDALAPVRDNVPIIDPTSGFISAGADVDRNTGIKQLPNMQSVDNPPNTVTPQQPTPNTTYEHRDRVNGKEIPSRTGSGGSSQVSSSHDPGVTRMLNDPGTWKGRKISDAYIRAKLGGWTSGRDPREVAKEQDKIWKKIHAGSIKKQSEDIDKAPSWRDEAALRFIYTPTTQRYYEDIDWDKKLPPKVLPPASTLEKQADPVSHRFTANHRYEAQAQPYQNLGRSWDWFQTRDGHYIRSPIEFCSRPRKNLQIPNYTGCIGGDGEKDDPHKVFIPLTVLRNSVPKYTDTANRPNIPKYTGCTHWTAGLPANVNVPLPPPQTTARVHRSLPVSPNESSHKRTSRMSRMITLVPPCNPFNKLDNGGPQLEQYH
ncbi:protein SPMIP7-like [Amphiura filiformis]|uniref:protein SPMIP7-like n=1 Tax=Amphiura filiformis TaxID=82378 RepID=UPI003B2202BB